MNRRRQEEVKEWLLAAVVAALTAWLLSLVLAAIRKAGEM